MRLASAATADVAVSNAEPGADGGGVLLVRLMLPAIVAMVLAHRPATGVEMMMQTAPEDVHAAWGAAALAPASEPAAAAPSLAATVAAVADSVKSAATENGVELAPLVASAALAASAAGAVAAPCAVVVVG